MALVVEDGTGRADAESLISEADADAYHSARGNSAWTGASAIKEAALRKAADYMEQAYRLRWAGYRTTNVQRLSWPRAMVPVIDGPGGYAGVPSYVEDDVVPELVRSANAELALLALSGDLNPALERLTRREVVGPIEVEYEPNSPAWKQYRSVDMMLNIYMQPVTSKLVRV